MTTKRKQGMEALQELEERLRLATAAAEPGVFEWATQPLACFIIRGPFRAIAGFEASPRSSKE